MFCFVLAALFVSPAGDPPEKTSAAVFEKGEVNAGDVVRAVWNVTGQGVFETYANGARVGDDFLKPGFTSCERCRHVYSYDVTDLLRRGRGETNVLSATVAPGWWCDEMMTAPKGTPWKLGRKVAFRGELVLTYADGTRDVRGTDASWAGTYAGPVVSAGIYEGETYDARRKTEGLAPVEINSEFGGELRPAAAKVALREDLALKPVGLYVTRGSEGATVTVRPSEMLNEANGEKARGNDGPAGTPYFAALRSARATLRYTLADGRNEFLPRHTFFGYRYLAVTTTAPAQKGK